jgi:putative pyruvate formate lyase activating enzyme
MGVMLTRFESLWIWERLRDKLPWYYEVSTNRKPAKYLICRRVPLSAGLSLKEAQEEELWRELELGTQRFLELWGEIRSGERRLKDVPRARPSLLDLCVELTKRMLRHCNFCRWNCRVDRASGTRHGTCQLETTSRVASYFHHPGEELVFRGTMGSGTIFFTSCNMRCAFCQNGDISTDKDNGIPITPALLALMAWQLRMEGCHNINWVGGEPTVHLHTIVEAISLLDFLRPGAAEAAYIRLAKADAYERWPLNEAHANYEGEFNVPQLWNSNFFMSDETLRILRLLMDVWLPDFKFGPGRCALFLARTPWYWETVTKNHRTVYEWGEDMVIRHLIMPGHVECCTKPVLDWIAKNMPDVPLNLMDQYHPDNYCDPRSAKFDPKYEGMARYPSSAEILEAYRHAERLGLNFEPLSYEKSMRGLRI